MVACLQLRLLRGRLARAPIVVDSLRTLPTSQLPLPRPPPSDPDGQVVKNCAKADDELAELESDASSVARVEHSLAWKGRVVAGGRSAHHGGLAGLAEVARLIGSVRSIWEVALEWGGNHAKWLAGTLRHLSTSQGGDAHAKQVKKKAKKGANSASAELSLDASIALYQNRLGLAIETIEGIAVAALGERVGAPSQLPALKVALVLLENVTQFEQLLPLVHTLSGVSLRDRHRRAVTALLDVPESDDEEDYVASDDEDDVEGDIEGDGAARDAALGGSELSEYADEGDGSVAVDIFDGMATATAAAPPLMSITPVARKIEPRLEDFTLQQLFDAGALNVIEEIEAVCQIARDEEAAAASIVEMKARWESRPKLWLRAQYVLANGAKAATTTMSKDALSRTGGICVVTGDESEDEDEDEYQYIMEVATMIDTDLPNIELVPPPGALPTIEAQLLQCAVMRQSPNIYPNLALLEEWSETLECARVCTVHWLEMVDLLERVRPLLTRPEIAEQVRASQPAAVLRCRALSLLN